MQRTRIKLAVYVDLDPVPGTFHSAESAQHVVRIILASSIPHYNPMVSIESYDTRRSEALDDVVTLSNEEYYDIAMESRQDALPTD